MCLCIPYSIAITGTPKVAPTIQNLEVSRIYIRRFSYSSRRVSVSIQEFFLCFLSFLISVPFSTLGERSGGTTVHTISADVAFHSSQSTSHPPDCFLSHSLDFALCDSSPASPMKDELYELQRILLCLPRDTLSRAHECLGLVLRIRLEELRMEGKMAHGPHGRRIGRNNSQENTQNCLHSV